MCVCGLTFGKMFILPMSINFILRDCFIFKKETLEIIVKQ